MDSTGRYVSIYFNGQPGNFPRLKCNPQHISDEGNTVKYANNSLVCEEDVDYIYTQHQITIISQGIPLTDTGLPIV